jgi:hypothetical protein
MSAQPHHAEIAALESALAALTPLPGRLDRDRLMFRAGQASRPARGWLWPAATAALALLAAGLGAALARRPAERVVHVPVPQQAPPVAAAPEQPAPAGPEPPAPSTEAWSPPRTANLQLQEQLLRWGLDGLPGLPPAPPRPAPLTRQRPDAMPGHPGAQPPFFLFRN